MFLATKIELKNLKWKHVLTAVKMCNNTYIFKKNNGSFAFS